MHRTARSERGFTLIETVIVIVLVGVFIVQPVQGYLSTRARAVLINLQFTLATTTSSGTESVTLHHAVQVGNLP